MLIRKTDEKFIGGCHNCGVDIKEGYEFEIGDLDIELCKECSNEIAKKVLDTLED